MVLHGPVELAALTGDVEPGTATCPESASPGH